MLLFNDNQVAHTRFGMSKITATNEGFPDREVELVIFYNWNRKSIMIVWVSKLNMWSDRWYIESLKPHVLDQLRTLTPSYDNEFPSGEWTFSFH